MKPVEIVAKVLPKLKEIEKLIPKSKEYYGHEQEWHAVMSELSGLGQWILDNKLNSTGGIDPSSISPEKDEILVGLMRNIIEAWGIESSKSEGILNPKIREDIIKIIKETIKKLSKIDWTK